MKNCVSFKLVKDIRMDRWTDTHLAMAQANQTLVLKTKKITRLLTAHVDEFDK